MNDLPITTLFMLMSVDGKISTGSNDERDFDKDLPEIQSLASGLEQYYELEKQTDTFSSNTGKVMAKVGWNEPKTDIPRLPVNFVIIDNEPHLTEQGVANLIEHSQTLYLVTTNDTHPANNIHSDKLVVIKYASDIDFVDLFHKLKKAGADTLTIQSGGDMNAALLHLGLINYLSVVTAPILIGGKDTASLIGGDSIDSLEDLKMLRPLKLTSIEKLKDSYLHTKYEVINK
ncbi:MAG: dihydrofolate reductase family protein [bacterium]|nr:dihydrofolate reductase family protein [bacterium]